MAETHPTCLASLIYLLRERFYRQVINTAQSHLKTYPDDPLLLFFRAFAVLNEGNFQEAIRELNHLRDKSQVSLCSLMALIWAHKQRKPFDGETVSELNTCLKTTRKTSGEKALYYGALLYWILGWNQKTKEYIEKMFKLVSASSEGLILKGWVFLTSENDVERSQAIRYFDSGLCDSKNVFGLMGKIEFFMARQKESRALEMINQILASYPDFIPAIVLKMNVFMSILNWEQTAEVAERILEIDSQNLKALQMMIIISAAKESDTEKVKEYLQLLLNAVEVTEPSTPSLHVEVTLPISRLCGHNKEVVQALTLFVQRSVSRAPEDSAMASELGYLLTLQHKYKEACRWYSKALNIDPSCMAALIGMIRCQLMDGKVEEAAQQLEFLHEVHQSIGRSAEVILLEAILARKKGADQKHVVTLLKEATELHLQNLRGLPHGVDYLERLNLNFLLQVVHLHVTDSQDMPYSAGQPCPFGLMHASMILEAVIKAAPYLSASCYYMARVKFLTGDQEAAQHFLSRCMDKEPDISCHLLQAKIYLHAGDYSRCLNSLEYGVSHNFDVRQMPQYNLIKARALKGAGNLTEAIQCLRLVMNMPGVKMIIKGRDNSISNSERASLFLELTDALWLNGEQHEATKVMQDALWQFKDTPEEMQVMVANVDLALMKDDNDTALNVLRNITPDHSVYIQAKEKMASIYLERLRNKRLYITCYREICEQLPGPHSRILLGDAFMKIQEPEKAIDVYKEAIKMAPKDAPRFAKKIGQALVKTHQYDKALDYYETALSTSIQDSICLELAELLLKVKYYERAQQIIEKALDHSNTSDLTTMINKVKLLRMFVKLLRARNEPCLDKLQQIYEVQQNILKRLPLEKPESKDEQWRVAAIICCEQAQEYRNMHDLERAKQCYSDALKYSPDDIEVNFQVAQLYYEHHKLDFCEAHCIRIMNHNEHHTATTMLYADVLFRENQKDEAIKIYADILSKHPGNIHALVKLLHMLRWVGKLNEIMPFFENYKAHFKSGATEPGYNYFLGLYYWHAYRVQEALVHLSQDRRDPEWGKEAIELIVHICLNPDKKTFGGELFESQEEGTSYSVPPIFDGGQLMGIGTAQNLLRECRPRSRASQEKVTILFNLCLIYGKELKQVESAVHVLSDMVARNVMLESSLLVAALGLLQLKQTPRARNFLKRISKSQWTPEIADDIEKSSLLLADMYIKMGKYINAERLLDDCIRQNKSCSKAYEYKGFIMENDQRYKDAAEQYELAWKFSYCRDPAIGYRLAFSYLKYKNYTAAIDVCHQVLLEHPDYPRIQTEILNRAKLSLRP